MLLTKKFLLKFILVVLTVNIIYVSKIEGRLNNFQYKIDG